MNKRMTTRRKRMRRGLEEGGGGLAKGREREGFLMVLEIVAKSAAAT